MKILVTGGAGYIGSTLVPMLLGEGHDVMVFDNFRYRVNPLLYLTGDSKLNIVKGDVRDREHLARVMTEKDAIIHLAALDGSPACDADPDLATETNITGTMNIVEMKIKPQILVYASSLSCYGATNEICTENVQFNPTNLYTKTKSIGDEMVRASGGVSLRFPTIFGVSARLRNDLLINHMAFQAVMRRQIDIYESCFKMAFLHVADAARSIIFALNNANEVKSKAFNVGDETLTVTKLQIAEIIQSIIPDCIIINHNNDNHDYKVSYKMIKDLGFKSCVSIEDGIKTMVLVFQKQSTD